MTPLIIDAVTIRQADRQLLSVDTVIEPGNVLTLMGPSGVGKSTLLAYIAGFLSPAFTATGRILLGDREITPLPAEKRHVGLLFQDPLLFPHLSVGGNLAFGMAAMNSRTERRTRIDNALAKTGLPGFYSRDPATLSGGQRARVALMRVLLSEPCAILLDEPFSKLDATLRADMRRMVFDCVREEGLPTLMVTHDAADAEAAGGEVIELGPG